MTRCSRRASTGLRQVEPWLAETPPGVADCFVEQPARQRRGLEHTDRPRSSGLAEDRHVPWVAAECRDVVVHPLERGDVVEDAVVARRPVCRLGGQRRVGEEPERAQPVVGCDHDHALARHRGAIENLRATDPGAVPATMEPDHDRQPLARSERWGPDVQRQTVLASGQLATRVRGVVGIACLPAGGSELGGHARAVPRLDRVRWAPPEITYRRPCERHSAKDRHILDLVGPHPFERAGRRLADGDTEVDRTGLWGTAAGSDRHRANSQDTLKLHLRLRLHHAHYVSSHRAIFYPQQLGCVDG